MNWHKFLELVEISRENCQYSSNTTFNDEFFEVRIVTGGIEGGNCWDGDRHSHSFTNTISSDDLKLLDLEYFLVNYVPALTYIQYLEISGKISTKKISKGEYYGNYTDYLYIRIEIKEVFDYLNSNFLI